MRFFDTNVLVYTQDALEPGKQAIARALVAQAIRAGEFTISTQVMQEFYAVATRRRLLSPLQAAALIQAWAENEVVSATPDLLLRAFGLQQSSQISVWDALIVQAALDSGCTTLYSDDMQHGMRFGRLELVNPFLQPTSVQERAAPDRAAKARTRGRNA